MKKILILAMSCNQDFFKEQEKHLKTIYAKDIIEGKYPNIEFYTYTASYDTKYHINKEEHKLYVPADDSLKVECMYVFNVMYYELIDDEIKNVLKELYKELLK